MLTLIRRGHRVPWALSLTLSVLLTACGGGDLSAGSNAPPSSQSSGGASTSTSVASPEVDAAPQVPGTATAPSSPAPDTSGAGPIASPPLNEGAAPAPSPPSNVVAGNPTPTNRRDAHRLAQQATFGPTPNLVAEIMSVGPKAWILTQLGQRGSAYWSGGDDSPDRIAGYCASGDKTCQKEYLSSEPLLRDFYRNALTQPDQLRQRMALALQQILVVSDESASVRGTYGFRQYQNGLLSLALGNYRDVLRKVTLSPMMGDYLNHVNNDKLLPNENFARELMQLFSIGLCELNGDGSLKGGYCQPTYDNQVVRNVAYALTGWTYPPGGSVSDCKRGFNCHYVGQDMVAVPEMHDAEQRELLAGVVLPSGSSPSSALEKVLDSLMQHPNMPPFIARQLIQHFVTSNPSAPYVARVASAFAGGSYDGIGTGVRGDLAATVAAVLLDPEARRNEVQITDGALREPVLLFTSVLRAFGGTVNSGEPFGFNWGDQLGQHLFMAPSVFNFYEPNYRVPGSAGNLFGPSFGIYTVPAAISRVNFLNCMLSWEGNCSTDLTVNLQPVLDQYVADGAPSGAQKSESAADGLLVDRLSLLAFGEYLPLADRAIILEAMNLPWSKPEPRMRSAAFLVFAHPRFQVPH